MINKKSLIVYETFDLNKRIIKSSREINIDNFENGSKQTSRIVYSNDKYFIRLYDYGNIYLMEQYYYDQFKYVELFTQEYNNIKPKCSIIFERKVINIINTDRSDEVLIPIKIIMEDKTSSITYIVDKDKLAFFYKLNKIKCLESIFYELKDLIRQQNFTIYNFYKDVDGIYSLSKGLINYYIELKNINNIEYRYRLSNNDIKKILSFILDQYDIYEFIKEFMIK